MLHILTHLLLSLLFFSFYIFSCADTIDRVMYGKEKKRDRTAAIQNGVVRTLNAIAVIMQGTDYIQSA